MFAETVIADKQLEIEGLTRQVAQLELQVLEANQLPRIDFDNDSERATFIQAFFLLAAAFLKRAEIKTLGDLKQELSRLFNINFADCNILGTYEDDKVVSSVGVKTVLNRCFIAMIKRAKNYAPKKKVSSSAMSMQMFYAAISAIVDFAEGNELQAEAKVFLIPGFLEQVGAVLSDREKEASTELFDETLMMGDYY